MIPKQDQSVPVTASEDGSSVSQPQVTPPFPSHPIWGAAHPPVVAGYGPYTKLINVPNIVDISF